MSHVKDCIEVAENTEVNRYYNLRMKDAEKLYEAYAHDEFRLIHRAFTFGYAQGYKAARAEMKKLGGSK